MGWIQGQKKTDFLCYYFLDSNELYIIDFKKLQDIWYKYKDYWRNKYGVKEAVNTNYISINVPVPISVLKKKLGKNMKKYIIK